MKLKKFTAMVSSAVMVFSLLAGLTVAKESKAEVVSELPTVTGLYMTDDFAWDWENGTVRTDTDQYGNTVLLNWDDEFSQNYKYADPEEANHIFALEDRESFQASGQSFWFDYIEDGNKVTHVSLADLTITYEDGTPCDEVEFREHDSDPRVIDVSSTVLDKPIIVTYTKATTNNKIMLNEALFEGFYSTSSLEPSIDSRIDELEVYKNGTTVGYYHIWNSEWEGAQFEFDAKTMLNKFECFDVEKGTDVDLVQTGEASKYVTFIPVSTDKHHLIFKVLFKAVPTADDSADIELVGKEHDIEETEMRDKNVWLSVKFVDGTAPTPAKGTIEKIGGLTYKVTGANAVTLTKGANKASVTIPAKVSIDGTSFKVTAIGKNAFKGCSKVKKLTVKSKTIKTVGKGAFKALKKSAVAKVPKSKKKAYKKLFKKGGFKGKVK